MPGQTFRNFEGGFLVKLCINNLLFLSIFPLTNLMTCCFFLTVPESNKLAEVGLGGNNPMSSRSGMKPPNFTRKASVLAVSVCEVKWKKKEYSFPTAINNLEVK